MTTRRLDRIPLVFRAILNPDLKPAGTSVFRVRNTAASAAPLLDAAAACITPNRRAGSRPTNPRLGGLVAAIMLIAALPASADVLGLPDIADSGDHIPLPAGVHQGLLGVSPVYGVGPSFPGTWSSDTAPEWAGHTFGGVGSPDTSSPTSGMTTYLFNLPGPTGGPLPVNTYFYFGDVDSGSSPDEGFSLKAYDSGGNQITGAWLNQPVAVSGPDPSEWVTSNMPSYALDSDGTYTILGNTVPGNPTFAFELTNNVPISELVLDKFTTNNGFGLLAPLGVPEPSSLVSVVLGLAGFLAYAYGWRRRLVVRRPRLA